MFQNNVRGPLSEPDTIVVMGSGPSGQLKFDACRPGTFQYQRKGVDASQENIAHDFVGCPFACNAGTTTSFDLNPRVVKLELSPVDPQLSAIDFPQNRVSPYKFVRIETPTDKPLNEEITVSFWVKATSTTPDKRIVSKPKTDGSGWVFYFSGLKVNFGIGGQNQMVINVEKQGMYAPRIAYYPGNVNQHFDTDAASYTTPRLCPRTLLHYQTWTVHPF